jgi:hypothetical protein
VRLQLPDLGVRVRGGQLSMTLDVYADLFDEDLDGVADRLDAAIKSAADRPHILVAGHRSALTQSGWRDSNPRPLRPERSALPSCATPRVKPRQRIALAAGETKRISGLTRGECGRKRRVSLSTARRSRYSASLTSPLA